MTSPVTSTSVGTKGADDDAGSKPSRRSTKGSIDPVRTPHSTIPTSAKPTVIATRNQCCPYRLLKSDQPAILAKHLLGVGQPDEATNGRKRGRLLQPFCLQRFHPLGEAVSPANLGSLELPGGKAADVEMEHFSLLHRSVVVPQFDFLL